MIDEPMRSASQSISCSNSVQRSFGSEGLMGRALLMRMSLCAFLICKRGEEGSALFVSQLKVEGSSPLGACTRPERRSRKPRQTLTPS